MSENTQVSKRMPFTVAIQSDMYKKLINRTLQDPERARRFVASITSAVSVNPALQECDPATILSGALLGESLNLTPSPQLGQMYLVPFNDKKNNYGKVAVFVLGYKGYLQLAVRSGMYKRIVTIAVKEGEYLFWNPYTEDLQTSVVSAAIDRDDLPTVGYYIEFETINGFRKAMFWNKEKMLNHADRYSAAFQKRAYQMIQDGKIKQDDMWKYSSFWYKDFDDMALKTMIRQCIPKWGPMSIDLQFAFDADDKIVNSDNTFAEPEPMELPAPIVGNVVETPEKEPKKEPAKKQSQAGQVSINEL